MNDLWKIHLPTPLEPPILFPHCRDLDGIEGVCEAVDAGSMATFDGFSVLGELADDFHRIVELSREISVATLLIRYRRPRAINWMKAAPIVLVRVERPDWWDVSEAQAKRGAFWRFAAVLSHAGYHPDKKVRLWRGLLALAARLPDVSAEEIKASIPGQAIEHFLRTASRDLESKIAESTTRTGKPQPLGPTEKRWSP